MKKQPGQKQKRICLVDDHPMMRQGLGALIALEPDLTVCCEADSAGQALVSVSAHKPDLVLADISLPDKNGLELIKDVLAVQPGVPILIVSMHEESLYAERVLRAGGRGYIMKQEGGQKMIQAIRQVLSGGIYVSDKMSARILETFSGRRSEEDHSPVEQLSDREFEVFQQIGEGKGTRDIAGHLHLSVKTVEVHRANIRKKLKLAGGTDVVHYAIRWVESQKPS